MLLRGVGGSGRVQGLGGTPAMAAHEGLALAQAPCQGCQQPATADQTSCQAASPGALLVRTGSTVNQCAHTVQWEI